MVQEVDVDTVDRLLQEEVPVVDVLGPESYGRQHLPGAVNVPVDGDDFEDRVQEVAPDKEAPVVVYCRDPECQASPAAAHVLEDHLGYQDVRLFHGGLVAWRRSGRPFEGKGPRKVSLEELKGREG